MVVAPFRNNQHDGTFEAMNAFAEDLGAFAVAEPRKPRWYEWKTLKNVYSEHEVFCAGFVSLNTSKNIISYNIS